MKKFVLSFVVLSLVAVLLAACGGSSGSCGSSSNGSSSGSTPTVHMCGNNFVQSSITVSKGHYQVVPIRKKYLLTGYCI